MHKAIYGTPPSSKGMQQGSAQVDNRALKQRTLEKQQLARHTGTLQRRWAALLKRR